MLLVVKLIGIDLCTIVFVMHIVFTVGFFGALTFFSFSFVVARNAYLVAVDCFIAVFVVVSHPLIVDGPALFHLRYSAQCKVLLFLLDDL